MQSDEFAALVEANAAWFSGTNPESTESLALAESRLGVSLPETMKWLLRRYGYSLACGLDNLEDSVAATLMLRERVSLPHHVILLNDWGDAGVVLLDSRAQDGVVIWTSSQNLHRLIAGEPLHDADVFGSYAMWVVDRLGLAKDEG